jgi:hypothetical protein
LAEQLTAHPYPLDALPVFLRDAVKEVQGFVQAPAALVACSALAALSLAAQGLVNVRRDAQLVGPVSLYLLSVAELRAPAHGGHDFGMMADSISGPWRTAFRFDGGHFRGESETLSAMIPKRLGL